MKRNATYLTDRHGSEVDYWTPCLFEFFKQHSPVVPVSECILEFGRHGPWFQKRFASPLLEIEGDIYREQDMREMLASLGDRFGIDLLGSPTRQNNGDIAGFPIDILVVRPELRGIYLIENKPFSCPSFTGNQDHEGAYVRFTKWLNNIGIPCEYLVATSIGISGPFENQVRQLQVELGSKFGLLLLEDIFAQMAGKFVFRDMHEKWEEYSDKPGFHEGANPYQMCPADP